MFLANLTRSYPREPPVLTHYPTNPFATSRLKVHSLRLHCANNTAIYPCLTSLTLFCQRMEWTMLKRTVCSSLKHLPRQLITSISYSRYNSNSNAFSYICISCERTYSFILCKMFITGNCKETTATPSIMIQYIGNIK